ncbi:MAG: cell division protein ZapE [Hyphomicrobiales bacterium]
MPNTDKAPSSILTKYRHLVANGGLEEDPAQLVVMARLDGVNKDLAERKLANKSSSLGWLFGKRKTAWTDVKGLYIWGSVGRGKTMLMDLFFEASNLRRKQRVHFHEFMADVHDRIHAHREAVKRGEATSDDPIVPVANAIADEVRLLCFDEFTVRDIADAMIMRRLFTQLFARHVVIIATSNVDPDDLYQDGLRRADFMPFIGLLKEHVDVAKLDARTDFRLEKLGNKPVYSHPLSEAATKQLDELWKTVTAGEQPQQIELTIKGRQLQVPMAALGAARFRFADLCEKPLGATDYLKIAQSFHTLFIEGIPSFTAEKRNEAKRFINLIDTLYDVGVKLVVTADAPPTKLNVSLREVEAFEFDRTVSRLIEMQSDEYLSAKTPS